MERKIYLDLKNGDFANLSAVLSAYETLSARELPDHLIEIIDHAETESIEFAHVREMTVQEFYQDFTAFVVPNSPHFEIEPFLPMLKKVSPGIYHISDWIPEVVFTRPDLKPHLRNYYYNLFGAETIETVLGFIKADQNASKAASELYMHRNTLNYRLDHFIATSEIDVRTFKGATAMFLLFRK